MSAKNAKPVLRVESADSGKGDVSVRGQNDKSKAQDAAATKNKKPVEIGGPAGLEPTRYGDWEAKGRCYDF